MGSDRDDELARTATAPVGATGSAPTAPADPVGPTLGRYKLERELGQGGMGVVHAAFDPDLERRVALKVLRNAGGSSEARQRLLREARAMARLQHPNVVTVHEVASANGRDYVAMEMIDGQSLAEWMRAAKRPENEIVGAFIAAGRGLAAAHAEGIVHRDFKPHNILRHRNGRIAVTDFGLARDVEIATDPLAETRELPGPAVGTAVSSSTPSSPLAGLTVTGSLLGTPAYMAPEQWNGGAVTPATDQFAFCVALWEALAGERPFKGPTVEQLRQEVERGPAKLDFAKIPRRLRPALMRGLDPDPAKRWPSMDALLAAMSHAEQKSKAIYIVAGAAITAGIAVLVAIKVAGGSSPAVAEAPGCRAPLLASATVWPAGSIERLATQADSAKLIAADVRAWTEARETACALDIAKREPVLACLDGVLARLEAVANGVASAGAERKVDAGFLLIDPAVCAMNPPPRLATTTTPAMRETIAAVIADRATTGRPPKAALDRVLAAAKDDPCAAVFARFLAIRSATPPERERLLAEIAEDGERCSDERVRADMALVNAQLALESALLGTSITSKVKIAELATARVMQPDLQAALESMRGEIARRADEPEEAIKRATAAAALFGKRGRIAAEVEQRIKVLDLEQLRATPKDLANLGDKLAALEAYAKTELGAGHDSVRDVGRSIADWEFRSGNVEGSMQRLQQLYQPRTNEPKRHIKGTVIDDKGKPVAGARVAAGPQLAGSTRTAAEPISDAMRFVTTQADGTFEIPDASENGAIIAEAGDLRSRPLAIADTVTLTLAPTATISGRVDLRGEPHQSVMAVAIDPEQPDMRYGWPAPVMADGTFAIGGVPRKKLKVILTIVRTVQRQAGFVDLVVKGPTVKDVKLELTTSKRVVHVVVRSTVNVPVGNAAVIIAPGKMSSMNVKQLRQSMGGIVEKHARQIEGERAPAAVVKIARAGDLFATVNEAPEGVASACAIALPQDVSDPKLNKKIDANLEKLRIECIPLPEGAEAVVIEVPPFPRLD